MKGNAVAFVVGLIFALGLGVAGMMMPAKVMGFLDITGDWDLSLALVMVGAIAVHTVFYRIVRGRLSPLLGGKFQIPTRTDLDARLLVGSAMFGAGWGLAGFCPGPALASVAGGSGVVLLFGGSMVLGMWLFGLWDAQTKTKAAAAAKGQPAASVQSPAAPAQVSSQPAN